VRGLISKYRDLMMERRARGDGRARQVSRSAPTEQRKGRGGGRKENGAQTSGASVSAAQKKKKKEVGRWAAAGTGRWAGGPAGLKRR
jgi:hypothetical protein